MERTSLPTDAGHRAGTMRGLRIERPGPLDGLELQELPRPEPQSGELVVRVHAAAVNPSDVLNVLGLPITTYPQTPGRDFSGVVAEGPEDLVGIAVWGVGSGDLGFTRRGSHAEWLTVGETAVVRHPEEWSHEQAGASGLAYATAAAGLRRAGLRPGQRVLVTGAAGGVGSAVCAVARWRGAEVVAAVKDRAEADRIARTLPDATVVVTADGRLSEAAAELTGGRGVDIAFDTVGTPLFTEVVATLADDGAMVVISARPNAPVDLDLSSFYRRRLNLHGVSSTVADATWTAGLLEELLPGFRDGSLPSIAVERTYDPAEAAQAYAHVASGRTSGRVVLTFQP